MNFVFATPTLADGQEILVIATADDWAEGTLTSEWDDEELDHLTSVFEDNEISLEERTDSTWELDAISAEEVQEVLDDLGEFTYDETLGEMVAGSEDEEDEDEDAERDL